jgi:signal transduction histidine kinase
MLNYGLKLALEELAESLMERNGDSVKIMADIQAGEERYPQNMEQHLYRIVQESCENALRHAKAGKITISGQLDAQKISLRIEDDGIGFDMGEHLELDNLIANNHFGLAGIIERASLIGAKADIVSGLQTGTRIQITWSHL